ncbi:MAG: hypothetical protein D6755_02395 [Anaerolineae bacterium]|nr:MAG: hypothetical protein D6755_02395 [Anaerolineae bacterium]
MMATSEERMRILKLVQDGKITPEEGVRLLQALTAASTPRPPRGKHAPHGRRGSRGLQGRWFRVRVSDVKSGRAKASINIPLGLMDWGLQIGAQFAPEVADIDLSQLSEMLQSGALGKIVDVVDEEDGDHVEIFIE